jgi:hypothetical protein
MFELSHESQHIGTHFVAASLPNNQSQFDFQDDETAPAQKAISSNARVHLFLRN